MPPDFGFAVGLALGLLAGFLAAITIHPFDSGYLVGAVGQVIVCGKPG